MQRPPMPRPKRAAKAAACVGVAAPAAIARKFASLSTQSFSPPSTPLRGIASEIRITRDPHGTPFISTSALSRSPSSPKRTNPKPLLLPVLGSVTTRAFRTEGYLSANVSCRA